MRIGDLFLYKGKELLFKGDADRTGYFIALDPENNYAGTFMSYHDLIYDMKELNPRWACYRYILNEKDLTEYKFFINEMVKRYAKKLGFNDSHYKFHIVNHKEFTDFIISECCRIKKGESIYEILD